MNTATGEMWLQHTHLDKLYGYLPGLADALPTIFGMSRAAYSETIERFAAQARAAAAELLADPAFATRVDGLPFQPGQTVLALGDSITDDLQSWAEILRHVLDLHRPGHGVRVVNAGLSAHTTAMVLRRWPATLTAARPDWIICALGGNDVTRVGPEPTKPQVSRSESTANLHELRRIAAHSTTASWIWMTPVPVREDRISEYAAFRYGQSTWRNDDILRLAEEIRGFADPVVDLTATFKVPADPLLQGADGVHPTIAGQSAILRALVTHLNAGAGTTDRHTEEA
ncbi:SGNH/GDSL hydrolase family protein [Micromonospora sp. WMMD1102]|uniref:SGNH/GDSL hydrolase family protein n=1 Tax=Micromonospora sp. WMMD1102 TaxID=3016105 RepID=UPI0024157520|nr:SGNH/GDSL hydrolase family protein [Micromonospora sp. WMMD1102]MDG4787507.1 SGNH/GDSL hydrolase family protein [Micromonospora sp. WMMD1102]